MIKTYYSLQYLMSGGYVDMWFDVHFDLPLTTEEDARARKKATEALYPHNTYRIIKFVTEVLND